MVGPANAFQARLLALWERALRPDYAIGAYDDFDSLGGDSLKALELIAMAETEFSITIPPGFLGRITNVYDMATRLEELQADQSASPGEEADFLSSRIYRQQRHLIASWNGQRIGDHGLIRTLGEPDARYDLFICLQLEDEMLQ